MQPTPKNKNSGAMAIAVVITLMIAVTGAWYAHSTSKKRKSATASTKPQATIPKQSPKKTSKPVRIENPKPSIWFGERGEIFEKFIQKHIQRIKNDAEWYKKVQEKAKKEGKSTDQELRDSVLWMIKNSADVKAEWSAIEEQIQKGLNASKYADKLKARGIYTPELADKITAGMAAAGYADTGDVSYSSFYNQQA